MKIKMSLNLYQQINVSLWQDFINQEWFIFIFLVALLVGNFIFIFIFILYSNSQINHKANRPKRPPKIIRPPRIKNHTCDYRAIRRVYDPKTNTSHYD